VEVPAAPEAPAPVRAARRRRARPVPQDRLPVLPLYDAVVLPGEHVVLPVGRDASLAAVAAARAGDGRLLLCPQRDPACERPAAADLHPVGTVCRLVEAEPDGEGRLRLAVAGLSRAPWSPAGEAGPGPLLALLEPAPEAPTADMAEAAAWLWRQVRALPELRGAESPEAAGLPGPERAEAFADALGGRLLRGREDRLALLCCLDPPARLPLLHRLVLPRLPKAPPDPDIARRAVRQMQEEHRRHHLREQLRAIQRELGEEEGGEAERWRERLRASGLPAPALEAGLLEAARLERMPAGSSEAAIARTYLDWLAALPWGREVPEREDLEAARRLLDAEHAGLDAVKERILEHLAVHLLRRRARGATPPAAGVALCLAGPPGTGKTSLARAMAEALGRPFVRVALGGVRDEAEIRGHRRTYVGALPGRIVAGLRRAGCANPVMLLDEIDKLGDQARGDPAAALLEVLDPEQQAAFADHYLEVPVDLRPVMFVATANDPGALPAPLRDRLDVVPLPGYGPEEKAEIVARHLIPRQAALHALPPGALSWTDAAVRALVRRGGAEAGVRALERQVAAVCRRAARLVLADPSARLHVTAANLEALLGGRFPEPPT
jgi:ATP-dependent Lon protease